MTYTGTFNYAIINNYGPKIISQKKTFINYLASLEICIRWMDKYDKQI